MNRLGATLLAWLLAPLTALLPSAVMVTYNGLAGNTVNGVWVGIFYITVVAYVLTTLVGIPTHLTLMNLKKSVVTNYAVIGTLSAASVPLLFAIVSGLGPADWTPYGAKYSAFLAIHGCLVATTFGYIFCKLTKQAPK